MRILRRSCPPSGPRLGRPARQPRDWWDEHLWSAHANEDRTTIVHQIEPNPSSSRPWQRVMTCLADALFMLSGPRWR
jgi:hypothetical protein